MQSGLPSNLANAGRLALAPTGGRSDDEVGGRRESLGPSDGKPRLAQTFRARELATGGEQLVGSI